LEVFQVAISENISGSKSVSGGRSGSRGESASPEAQRRSLLYPALIVVVLITQIPFLYTIYLSLQSWNIIRPDLGQEFVGLGNYASEVFTAQFLTIMLQTLAMAAMALVICCLVGLGLALLLNRQFFGKGLVQTLLVTPFFIMPTVTGLIWKNELFSPNFGLVTWFVGLFGVEGFNPMAQAPLFMVSTMVAWQWEPLFMLVLLAGLAAIPEEEKEAAQLDGCGRFGIFRYVELPHLLPYYRMVILLGSIFILQVFGEIYVATAGGPGTSSMNLQYLTFQTGLVGWQVGAASAIGVATLVLTLVILTGLLRTMNAVVREGA
jgi:sorbitol/mannitol transport system permease protein